MAKSGDVRAFADGAWKAADPSTLVLDPDQLEVLPTTVYLGPIDTDGSYRFTISGTDLLVQRYVTDTWVTQLTIPSGG